MLGPTAYASVVQSMIACCVDGPQTRRTGDKSPCGGTCSRLHHPLEHSGAERVGMAMDGDYGSRLTLQRVGNSCPADFLTLGTQQATQVDYLMYELSDSEGP